MRNIVVNDVSMLCANEDKIAAMIPIAFIVFLVIFIVYWRMEK